MDRGQASLTAIEAAIGVLLLLSVTFTFVLGPAEQSTERTQLEAYASDTLTVLSTEQPRHSGATRLNELVASEGAFEREKETVERRIERILPSNVMYRLETQYGTAGHRLPDGVATGTATTTTPDGPVTLRVWYV